MCGEKSDLNAKNLLLKGSPLLARGKETTVVHMLSEIGIIPACAGKSRGSRSLGMARQDHPRLRGEKAIKEEFSAFLRGSPPLARGKELVVETVWFLIGITPACAGKRLKKSKNTYDPKCPVSAFHSVFQTQQMSGDNPQAHDAMRKRPFQSGMRVSSIYNPKQSQVFFLPIEAYRHMGF